jgi:hypothetical protein
MSCVPAPDESEDITQRANAAAVAYAELSTAEASLDERDYRLYTLIWHGDVELTEDGDSATFTREWIDDAWLRRRSAYAAKDPDAPLPRFSRGVR